jgi:MYXO-CTERM domain-containing protein
MMSLKRRGLRVTTALLGFFGAFGVGSARADQTDAIWRPHGVHHGANGRYSIPICEVTPHMNCFGRWLLPPDWEPGQPLPELRNGVPVPSSTPFATGTPMGPSDVIAAYSLPPTAKANGKVVAIIDSADNHALADVNAYRQMFGIPALTQCASPGVPSGTTPCFSQINWDGSPSTMTDPSTQDDGETSLDMDMISAACDDCSILLVETSKNFCPSEILGGVATAIKLGASAVSISLGGPETTDPKLANIDAGSIAMQCPNDANITSDAPGPYSTPGHLVFAASGDFAYDNTNAGIGKVAASTPSYPSSSPNVIAVGGTTLYKTASGYSEGVWNDGRYGIADLSNPGNLFNMFWQDITTSGCSTEFAMPMWQASVLSGTTCSKRATADISAAANFNDNGTATGIGIYAGGMFTAAEGTSAASPLVAAIFTRLGLTTAASNDLGWITENIAAFNDVGSSSYPLPDGGATADVKTTTTCGKLCVAGTGWDGPSGVGTPNGTKLAALAASMGGGSSGGGGSSSGAGSSSGGVSSSGGGSSGGNGSSGGGGSSGSIGGSGSGTLGGSSGGSNGGSGGSGGGFGDNGGSDSSSGCSCRTAPGAESGLAGLAWLGVAGVGLLRGRRRSRR